MRWLRVVVNVQRPVEESSLVPRDRPEILADRVGHPEWDPSIELHLLPGLLWRRKGWVIAAVLLSMGLGIAYMRSVTPVYNVRARLLVELRELPLQERSRLPRAGKFLATQAEIIHSPAVIGPAMASVSLAPFEGSEEEHLASVLSSFTVTPVDRTNVLVLSYFGPNPDDGVRLVEATIESYRGFVHKNNQAETHALDILTRKEQELREDLGALEAQYAAFRTDSGLVGSNQEFLRASRGTLNMLETQMAEARIRRLDLEAETNALEREVEAARIAERALNDQYSRELARVKALDSQQIEGRRILSEMERVREVHQWTLVKLNQWELTQEAVTQLEGGVQIRMLEGPGVPSKVWPKPLLILGPCLLVGLVGGFLLALIVDYARPRIA
jgi:uncharacterized protein involved in exopolysaccharide biosynthesis